MADKTNEPTAEEIATKTAQFEKCAEEMKKALEACELSPMESASCMVSMAVGIMRGVGLDDDEVFAAVEGMVRLTLERLPEAPAKEPK